MNLKWSLWKNNNPSNAYKHINDRFNYFGPTFFLKRKVVKQIKDENPITRKLFGSYYGC